MCYSKWCVAFSLLFSSCQVSSRIAMQGEGGRIAYNATLQKTNNEQMLLNLVRLRYVEFPCFLEVSNVTTQVTTSSKFLPTLPIPGFNSTNPGLLGGEFFWQNQPTISYMPLDGQLFTRQLLHPLGLMIIPQLIYAGWDIDRVLRICAQSINNILNAPTASDYLSAEHPHFTEFIHLTGLLRFFQEKGLLKIGVKTEHADKEHDRYVLQIKFPINGEKAQELKDLLGNTIEDHQFYMYDIPLGFNSTTEVGLMPRSLLACMYYLSVGVDIPTVHNVEHCAWTPKNDTECSWKELMKGLVSVKHSKTKPNHAAVAVLYKGFWFYIDDSDVDSKRTFFFLLELYNLQSSMIKQDAPILTLPLG